MKIAQQHADTRRILRTIQINGTGFHNKAMQPKVLFKIKYVSKNRKKEVAITRLRLGKCKLNKYLNTMKCHPDGLCPKCKQMEDIQHYILKCAHTTINPKIRTIVESLNNDLRKLQIILSDKALIDLLYESLDREL